MGRSLVHWSLGFLGTAAPGPSLAVVKCCQASQGPVGRAPLPSKGWGEGRSACQVLPGPTPPQRGFEGTSDRIHLRGIIVTLRLQDTITGVRRRARVLFSAPVACAPGNRASRPLPHHGPAALLKCSQWRSHGRYWSPLATMEELVARQPPSREGWLLFLWVL